MASKTYTFAAIDATREAILIRATFSGPTGSGKTLSALILATRMVEIMAIGPLFVVDSENKSALRYAWSPKTKRGFHFKHVAMPEDDYSPDAYMAALNYCEAQGAGVVIVDSLSHAWNGINGVLEQVDQVTQKSRTKNGFSEGWGAMTPVQNRLIQRLLSSSCHIIWTMRSKVHYEVTKDERTGKASPQKMGMAPIQREGVDYEPDLSFEMDRGGSLFVSKSRALDVPGLALESVHEKPGNAFADIVIGWLQEGEARADAGTIGEAINIAVAEGISAAEEKSVDRYKNARRDLLAWCVKNGVGDARRDDAMAQLRARVAVVTGAKTPAEPPADSTD